MKAPTQTVSRLLVMVEEIVGLIEEEHSLDHDHLNRIAALRLLARAEQTAAP